MIRFEVLEKFNYLVWIEGEDKDKFDYVMVKFESVGFCWLEDDCIF